MRTRDIVRSKWIFGILSIALAVAFLMLLNLVAAQGTGNLTRITVASDSDRDSRNTRISADERVLAFSSDSDFLGQGIPDGQKEVWLYDTTTMTFTRITTASDSNRDSGAYGLNADGAIVAFHSDSDFLGQGIPDDQYEVWLYDTTKMTFTRITTASDSNRDSYASDLSADGAIVAFYSDSDFLGQGIPDDQREVWLYDTAKSTYTRATTASDSNRDSSLPRLSADGAIVAFQSDSDFLSQGIPDDQYEVWLYDTTAMTYTRITTASDSNRDSYICDISASGTVIAFSSDSDFLDQGIPGDQREVWLYNTMTMTYTRVTTASDSNRDSDFSYLDADGTIVVFQSDSDFLSQGIPDGQIEVWLYDTTTMTFTRITTASDSNRSSSPRSLGASGTVIAFSSDSDFLGQGIPDDQTEIWLYTREYQAYLPLVLKQAQ